MGKAQDKPTTIHLRDVLRKIDPNLDTDRATEAMREVIGKPEVKKRLGWDKKTTYASLPAKDNTETIIQNLVFLRAILLPRQIVDLCDGDASRWSYGMDWVGANRRFTDVAVRYDADLKKLFEGCQWLMTDDLLSQALSGKSLKNELFAVASAGRSASATAGALYHSARDDEAGGEPKAESAYELYCAGQEMGADRIAEACIKRNCDDAMALFVKALLLLGESRKHSEQARSASMMAAVNDGMTQDALEYDAEVSAATAAGAADDAAKLVAKALDSWPVRGGYPELRDHRERAIVLLLRRMYALSLHNGKDKPGGIAPKAMCDTTLRILKELEPRRDYLFDLWPTCEGDLIWLELYWRLSKDDYERFSKVWLNKVVGGHWYPDEPLSVRGVVTGHIGILIPDLDRRTELLDRIRTAWLRHHDRHWDDQQWQLHLDQIRERYREKRIEECIDIVRRARRLIWDVRDCQERDHRDRQYLHLRLLYDAAKLAEESGNPGQAAEHLRDISFHVDNLWSHFSAWSRQGYMHCDDDDYQEYSDLLGNTDDIVNSLDRPMDDESVKSPLVVLLMQLQADEMVPEYRRQQLAKMLEQAKEAKQA